MEKGKIDSEMCVRSRYQWVGKQMHSPKAERLSIYGIQHSKKIKKTYSPVISVY